MAERLLELMNAWKIEKAVVAGFDMGGQAALAFAARYPQRLDSLVVMNSLVQWDEATSLDIAILRKFGWNRLALRHFPRVVFTRALRTFMSAGQAIDPALRSDMWEAFKQSQVREFIVRMCAGYEKTLRRLSQEYSSIQIPSLVLWAEHDKHFPLQQAKRLAAALPNARLEIVPRAKHWMPLSMPHEVAPHFLPLVTESAEHPTET
jgi:pimeloyl-ACP methyl ester carboxylesterase